MKVIGKLGVRESWNGNLAVNVSHDACRSERKGESAD
jgi:hypothetical protein